MTSQDAILMTSTDLEAGDRITSNSVLALKPTTLIANTTLVHKTRASVVQPTIEELGSKIRQENNIGKNSVEKDPILDISSSGKQLQNHISEVGTTVVPAVDTKEPISNEKTTQKNIKIHTASGQFHTTKGPRARTTLSAKANTTTVIGQLSQTSNTTRKPSSKVLNTNTLDNTTQKFPFFTGTQTTTVKGAIQFDTNSEGLGTAEKVVFGAVGLVVCLAILAIFLRLLMPKIHARKSKKNKNIPKIIAPEIKEEEKPENLTGYQNLGADTSSTSSQSSSSGISGGSGQEWSEVSSNKTRSTYASDDNGSKKLLMAGSFGNLRSSTMSLPVYLPEHNRPHSDHGTPPEARRLNDDLISVLSTHSMEPIRMADAYRNRWDDQWDPYGSLPRSGLCSQTHPSENKQIDDTIPHTQHRQNNHPREAYPQQTRPIKSYNKDRRQKTPRPTHM